MRVVEKAYAKINLALCVTGAKDGFHTLDSVVTTVDLYDTVTLTTRKDDNLWNCYDTQDFYISRYCLWVRIAHL